MSQFKIDFSADYSSTIILYNSPTLSNLSDTLFSNLELYDNDIIQSIIDSNIIRINKDIKFKTHIGFMNDYLNGKVVATTFSSNRHTIIDNNTSNMSLGLYNQNIIDIPINNEFIIRNNIYTPNPIYYYSKLIGYNKEDSAWEMYSVHVYDISENDNIYDKIVLYENIDNNSNRLYFSTNTLDDINTRNYNKLLIKRTTKINLPEYTSNSYIGIKYKSETIINSDRNYAYKYGLYALVGSTSNRYKYPITTYIINGYQYSNTPCLMGFDKNSVFGIHEDFNYNKTPHLLIGDYNRSDALWVSWKTLEADWSNHNPPMNRYMCLYPNTYGEVLPYSPLSTDENNIKYLKLNRFRGSSSYNDFSCFTDILFFIRKDNINEILDYLPTINTLAFCYNENYDVDMKGRGIFYIRTLNNLQLLRDQSLRILLKTGLTFTNNEQILNSSMFNTISAITDQNPIY